MSSSDHTLRQSPVTREKHGLYWSQVLHLKSVATLFRLFLISRLARLPSQTHVLSLQALWWQKLLPELCDRTRAAADNSILLAALKGRNIFPKELSLSFKTIRVRCAFCQSWLTDDLILFRLTILLRGKAIWQVWQHFWHWNEFTLNPYFKSHPQLFRNQ